MKIKILNEFDYQTYPLDSSTIEVSEQVLEQIGITKCFDLDTMSVVDYDNSEELEKQEKQDRIQELKQLLSNTDYKAIKYAEGMLSEEEYAETKALRQSYRDEINKLEEELNIIV